MTFQYESLTSEEMERVKDNVVPQESTVDYTSFLPAWESEHYSHFLLCQQLRDSGEHPEGQCEHETAMDIIATSITNVRQGLAPDAGQEQPVVGPVATDSPVTEGA